MDDAIGAIVGWIILAIIAIYLLSLAIFGIVLAVGMALTSGLAVGAYRLGAAATVREDACASLAVQVDGSDFHLTVDRQQVAEKAKEFLNLATLIALGAAALVGILAGLIMVNDAVVQQNKELTTWIVVLGIIGGLVGSYRLVRRWSFEPWLSQTAESHAALVADMFERAVGDLLAVEGRIETIAEREFLLPPTSLRTEMFQVFEQFGSALTTDVHVADRAVFEVLNRAGDDEKRLEVVANELTEIRCLHRKATDAAADSGFRSLYASLDVIHGFLLSPHLSELVESRQFDEVRSQIAAVEQELNDTIAKAESVAGDAGRDRDSVQPNDIWCDAAELTVDLAFRRLSARPGDPPTRLKRIYLALVRAYNSDQGSDGDPRRFQQINDAYSLLKSRGLAQ